MAEGQAQGAPVLTKLRPGDFKISFEHFILDRMLVKNPRDSPLELTKTLLLHCPQPSSLAKFAESARETIVEDIKKLSQYTLVTRYEANRTSKKDNYFNDSRDPSYYDRRLQNEISEEYEPDKDPKTDDNQDGSPDQDPNSMQLPAGHEFKPASKSKDDLNEDNKQESKPRLGDDDPNNEMNRDGQQPQDELEFHRRLRVNKKNHQKVTKTPKVCQITQILFGVMIDLTSFSGGQPSKKP
jgi:hypothetical protein